MNLEERIIQAFNKYTGKNHEILDDFYAPDVHFIDPVTNIFGLERLTLYYIKTYKNVESIKFNFTDFIEDKNKLFAQWTMTLQVKGLNSNSPFEVEGASLFEFNSENKVVYHRDYVDLGAMIYERLPVIGALIQLIKRKLHS